MKLQNWSEDQFIDHIAQLFPSKQGILGIGDDCAVIPAENGKAWLVTTDALVEGVHFIKEQIPAKDLGYKAVAVNVSDIAAMGGEPKYAFLSIALPKTVDCSWVKLLMDGIKGACDKWNILLLGGDTVGSKRDVFINITLVGSAFQDKIKYRNGAQDGDVICVTANLGDSGAGLKAIQEKIKESNDTGHFIHAHFHPEPSPEQGIWLAGHHEVHSMMDISDGLNCDLQRLVKASKKGAEIDVESIPVSQYLSNVEWDALELALVGGEDYCLLLTVAPESCEKLQREFEQEFNRPLFPIGKITNQTHEVIYSKSGKKIQIDYSNYNHFH